MAASDPLTAVLNIGNSIIERIWADPVQQSDAKLKLLAMAQSGDLQIISEQSAIIQAETKSESKLTQSWRPITMLCFVAIIVNNYIIYPYLSLFWHAAPLLPLPTDLWDLLKIGIGGYVVGRSAEKISGPILDTISKFKTSKD
jgi:hypothetical protein